MKLTSMTLAAAAGVAALLLAPTAFGASHREAPLIAQDPSADITDVYAFVSYDEANLGRPPADQRVTLIMNVIPGQDPADGPNYFSFGDDVLYRLHIDNNANGKAENLVYEFRFSTETRPALGSITGPIPLIGNPKIGAGGTALQGIRMLDGKGSEGITRRQTYTVTEVRNGSRTPLFKGQKLIAVPSNVGPFTIPEYEDLASQGVYEDGKVRVFAGQRAETFYIDLGAVFDTVNLRRELPVLSQSEDANDMADPFGINRFSGFNVNTIAIELPISRVTSDGKPATTAKNPVIGVYASTSRQSTRELLADGQTKNRGSFVQVARLANPLVNELVINTPSKDFWNRTDPKDEAKFQAFYLNPTVVTELGLIFPNVPVKQGPRLDLLQLLLKYEGQAFSKDGKSCGTPCSELLRLDLRVPPTAAEGQSRLGKLLGGDPAGFPNGRRPNDDVTDIFLRAAGGDAYIQNRVGDGVNFLAGAPGAGLGDGPGYGLDMGNILDTTANGIAKEFPFLPTPFDGRNRVHMDCGEAGVNPCN